MPNKSHIWLFFFLTSIYVCQAQPALQKKLEKQIKIFNDKLEYERSIATLTKIINDPTTTHYEKYYAYLLESFTYKRLFNYSKTLQKLDLALAEGIQSDQKEVVINTITAEKCFVYFDKENFSDAALLIDELKKQQFKHISSISKAWLIMQEGYIKMLNNDFVHSEHLLNDAISLLQTSSPEDLPNIYGKKITLYNKMKAFDKRDIAFKDGLAIAKKYNKIKYEMYLHQVMRNVFQENKDYKNAFFIQKKYDALSKFYDAVDNNGKLEITEKNLEDQNRILKDQNKRYVDYILYGIIIFLIILLSLAIRLYQLKKGKAMLIEKENNRIHNEIEKLTKALDQKGNAELDLSKYNLTNRQKEIIAFIKEGSTNKEIATRLFISENTVKYHLKIIYEILDIENRSQIY